RAGAWDALCAHARDAGFNGLLVEPLWDRAVATASWPAPRDPDRPHPGLGSETAMPAVLARLAREAARYDLRVTMDLVMDRTAADSPACRQHPDWYERPVDDPARDPRSEPGLRGIRRLRSGPLPAEFLDEWRQRMALWLDAGLAGFRIDAPHRIGSGDWRTLLGPLRAAYPGSSFLAWTPGMDPRQLESLRGAGFDAVFSSLPWWDRRSAWLADEHERLRAVAPVIAMPAPLPEAAPPVQVVRGVWSAAVSGDGILVAGGIETYASLYRQVNAWLGTLPAAGALRVAPGVGD